MKKIRVLVVDDSALIRQMFSKFLNADPEIEVVGVAPDPFIARQQIKELNPDVITLDIEMPKMDGLTFLEKIMTLRPMPVVMVSSLTRKGADETIRALETGAVDYISKPADSSVSLDSIADELRAKVKCAASARIAGRKAADRSAARLSFAGRTAVNLIAIGASTGGVEALRDILEALPDTLPPIVITQHMPPTFTASFAARLDKLCAISVHEARNGQPLLPGHAYIAPGGLHLEVARQGSAWKCVTHDEPAVSGHRPSVDVLFRSVAREAGADALGAILTGMGKDGAQGMLLMRQAGAHTIGQNEASCVVYGMPRAAFDIGAVAAQLPLSGIAAGLVEHCGKTV